MQRVTARVRLRIPQCWAHLHKSVLPVGLGQYECLYRGSAILSMETWSRSRNHPGSKGSGQIPTNASDLALENKRVDFGNVPFLVDQMWLRVASTWYHCGPICLFYLFIIIYLLKNFLVPALKRGEFKASIGCTAWLCLKHQNRLLF